MAKNTIADLDTVPANNTDLLGQASTGSADANTIDTILQNLTGIIARAYGDVGGLGTVGGSANAVTLTSLSTYQALETGLLVSLKAGSANTAAATLNLDGLGAKAIRRQGDTALLANDMVANGRYLLLYDASYNSAAGAWVLLNPASLGSTDISALINGKQTIWVPATAMDQATTNGPSSGSLETTTNKVMVKSLDFDPSIEEFAQFSIQMPKSWNEGTLIAQFVWTHGATTTNFGVVWGIEAVAFANDDALDAAWGTEVDTTDTGGTTNDLYISPESAAVTVAGSPGAEEYLKFRITRVVGAGGDTMAVDAKLLGVKIIYTTDAGTDN